MCEQGDTIVLNLPGRKGYEPCDIDRCIAPLVQTLNNAGFFTKACCCGHGHRPGNIVLRDGRELLLLRSYEEARSLDWLWPNIQGETIKFETLETPGLGPAPQESLK